jgi:hypothetical protein
MLFADDGIVAEQFYSAGGRYYVSRRLSIGPEMSFVLANSHSHFILTGNVTCDLVASRNGRPRRVTPYALAGGGLFNTREQFFNGPYSHTEGAFTLGGGVRFRISQTVTAGVDARLGWEPHLRLAGVVGVQLPK